MTLAEEIFEAIKCREEKFEIAGRTVTVRSLAAGDATESLIDNPDAAYKLLTLCVFDEAGNRVFSDEDIPALKAASRGHVKALMEAVNRLALADD